MYWRLAVSIALVVSLPACEVNKHGAGTPHLAVDEYILALEKKDRNLMLHLMPEHDAATGAIADKISKFGGHKIRGLKITYVKEKPVLWVAKLQGFYLDRNGNRQKIEDKVTIEYRGKGFWKLYGGRWYLLLDRVAS